MNEIFKIGNKNNVEVYSSSGNKIPLSKVLQNKLNFYINELDNFEKDFLEYIKGKDSFNESDIGFFIGEKDELDLSEFD